MTYYRVIVQVKTTQNVDPEYLAQHVCDAVSQWGGQYPSDDDLFSSEVRVKAECRGAVCQDEDFDE